ncbi:MAG: phosphoribosyltransferase [Desulfobacteraceae bacterium]|nr:phosphoribosyltransferase [Desulfobacteraceae bacterium]
MPSDAIFVAPHAREASGDNAIPQILAVASALAADGTVDTDIVQITRVFHTGADPMERMVLRPEFDGAVKDGDHYVLVDDVTNMGGTLAELSNYIRCAGGIVSAVIVLVNAGRSKQFHPAYNVINKIERRFSNEIRDIFGIVPSALTANEANYIIGFRSVDEIRNRMAKAKKETNLRLRSKGIERQDQSSHAQIFTAK